MTWPSVSSPIPGKHSIHRSPAQPRFGSGEQGDATDVDSEDVPKDKEQLAQRLKADADNFMKRSQELEKRAQELERLAADILPPASAPASAAAVQSTGVKTSENKTGTKPASTGKDDISSKDAKVLQLAAANWTSRNERTRFKVLMDLGKQYITRGPLLSDSLWSLGIGAVLAIGSPVMTVTIPTTFAFFLAGRAVMGLIHACQDPKGNSINAKYQKWIEKDAEKLKKQEAR